MSNSGALTPLADRIAATLEQEHDAVAELASGIDQLLLALRKNQPDLLEDGASRLQAQIRTASELRLARERQTALFCRAARIEVGATTDVLAELARHDAADTRHRLRTALTNAQRTAQLTGSKVAALDYALRFATQINHELVCMLHGLIQPDGGRVYTARGRTTAPTNRRSLLNQMG